MTLTCPICRKPHSEVCIQCKAKCPVGTTLDGANTRVYACMNPACKEFLVAHSIGDKQGVEICHFCKIGATPSLAQTVVNKRVM
jgi:hypothetical protein